MMKPTWVNWLAMVLLCGITVARAQTSEDAETTGQILQNEETAVPFAEVRGKVISAQDNAPVSGARVSVRGTDRSTVSKTDGSFSIEAGPDAVLVVSHDDYGEQTVRLDGRTEVEVVLSGVVTLERMVVVGYGTQKEKNITSAITSVSPEQLAKMPIGRIDQALQGVVPGVQVTTANGQPGAAVKVTVRGVGTVWLDEEPLYVVDGVILKRDRMRGVDPLASLKPEDIQDIQVLKDASAAAIYGVRSANGVVLITTRRGAKGETKVTANAEIGLQQVSKTHDVMNTEQYRQYIMRFYDTSATPGVVMVDSTETGVRWAVDGVADANTDWNKEMYRTALVQNYSAAIEGGGENARAYFSAGYTNQEGTMRGTGHQRFSLRLNSDFYKGILKFGESMSFGQTKTLDMDVIDAVYLARVTPQLPLKGPDSTQGYGAPYPDIVGVSNYGNPVAFAELWDRWTKQTSLVGNVYLDLEPLSGLVFHAGVSADLVFGRSHFYNAPINQGVSWLSSASRISEGRINTVTVTTDDYLKFDREFQGHNLGLTLGLSVSDATMTGLYATGFNLPPGTETISAAADSTISTEGNVDKTRSASFYGRLTYDFRSRYLLTGTLRYDGTSTFDPQNRWALFPAFSLGWRASEEEFLKGNEYVSDLKLRVGYGSQGRSGTSTGFLGLLNEDIRYSYGGQLVTGAAPSYQAPEDPLKWETVKQFDGGLDVGLFKGNVTLTTDVFVQSAEDMLIRVYGPRYSGMWEPMWSNKASVRNTGVELTLGHKKSDGAFTYNLRGNMAFVSNEVTGLAKAETIYGTAGGQIVTITRKGDPIGSFYGFETAGIFQNDAEIAAWATQPGARPGDVKFVDQDGNGVIDDDDRVILGDPMPDMTYGLNLDFGYKGFDLGFFFQGVAGNEILNMAKRELENTSDWNNGSPTKLDAWDGEGTSNDMPRISQSDDNSNSRISDRYIENGSYLRLKTLQLGYSLPKKAAGRIGLDNLRVYVAVSNLFTVTGYSGLDPDVTAVGEWQGVGIQADVLTRGVDFGRYACPRIYSLGVQMVF